MDIEDVFSSKVRMKILKALMQAGELNVTEIARRLGSNYNATMKHLKILESEGVLQRRMFGRIRSYRFNEHSQKAVIIQQLIESWIE